MANIDAELEQQLKEAGKQLSRPSDSVDELLALLDQIEKLLSKVDQSPKKSMLDALKPSMKALIQESLLKHSDIDVKVAVASCVSEITRITAPDAPYDDDQMRDIFQLIVSSFEDIADQSSRSYIKRASILETVSKVRSCVIMFDLECDALIVEMFEHFLRSVRDYHHESIYPSMESIMVLVLEESEEIPVEMLKPLLASVKKDSEGVLPVARKLAEGVLLKSADKLKPYLMPAIVSLGDTLDKYTKVVASVCEGKTAAVEHNDEIASGVQQANKSKLEKESVDEAHQADESKFTSASSEHMEQVSNTIKYDKSLVGQKVKVWWPEDKMYYEGVIESFDAAKKKHKVLYVEGEKETLNLKTGKWEILEEYSVRDEEQEDSDSEAKSLKLSVKKGQKRKPTAEEEEESDSENKPLKLSAKKGSSKKKDDGRKCGSGKNATENDQAKALSSDDEMDYSPKSAAKSAKRESSSKEIPVNSAKRKLSTVKDKVSDTIKYDESLVGSNVKIWWPEDKMYYEGVIESFDAAKKKHKLLYVNGEKETLNLKTEKWEILKEYSVRDKADESNLTTTSPDPGQVFKDGACPEEVDSTLNRPLKSVMINGVDVTGNQEASLDLEPSKKSEKEVIYLESLNKKDTDGTNKDKESKPEDQASKKRGKEDDTVINSTESMVGLAHKRASRETSDVSAKKSRVSRVAGDSSLVPVACSTDATVEGRESERTTSGHLPLGDKDVMCYPSHQVFLLGASTPAMEERVRQMGPSGVVDRLTGMANESAALFSHAAESIRALELDNSELKRQLNELVLRDKGYYEKISVLEGEIADLKSLHDQMKLTCEARVVDADRRATEAERRFAEAKREMEVQNFKLKKQLDEHVLCDQGYEEKIRILGKRLAEAKRKMVGAEGSMKAALASLAL